MSSRRVWIVAGMVIAFAVAGAGWKSSTVGHMPSAPYAGWSWDGIATSTAQS